MALSSLISMKMDFTTNEHPAEIKYPAPTFLRMSAGFIYFLFGFLKFYPDLSPAELLAGQTIMRMSYGMVDAATALWWLAVMECVIGVAFLLNIGLHWVFFVFLAHQFSTFLPLFVFPELTFKIAPFAPTIEGQYILKNLISVAAGWTVMGPRVRLAWSRPAVPAATQFPPSADPEAIGSGHTGSRVERSPQPAAQRHHPATRQGGIGNHQAAGNDITTGNEIQEEPAHVPNEEHPPRAAPQRGE